MNGGENHEVVFGKAEILCRGASKRDCDRRRRTVPLYSERESRRETLVFLNGGMDANTLKSLKRKYFFAPLMLWYMKRCNYEKLKPTRIKADMSHIRNESAEEIAYVSGGHLSTVVKADDYIRTIRAFLSR